MNDDYDFTHFTFFRPGSMDAGIGGSGLDCQPDVRQVTQEDGSVTLEFDYPPDCRWTDEMRIEYEIVSRLELARHLEYKRQSKIAVDIAPRIQAAKQDGS